MKLMSAILIIVGLALSGFVLAARSGFFFHSDNELKARYANDGSMFTTVDSVPLRYKDEGTGPALILIHGAFGNLNMWNDWAEILSTNYRIIRIDDPPEGLSGPDPSGQFGHDRNVELVRQLAAKLNVPRFAIGGTSRGAVVSYRYAAKYPEQITHLILVNTPVLPQAAPSSPNFLRFARGLSNVLGRYEPEFYWQSFLEFLFFDPTKVTDRLVKEYADFNNRVGKESREEIVRSGAKRDVEEISRLIGSIRAPTLIIASQSNAALALEDQRAMENMFSSTKPEFRLIKEGGHLLPIENGQETGLMVKQFLDAPAPPE